MHVVKKGAQCKHMLESTCYMVQEQICDGRIAYTGKMELFFTSIKSVPKQCIIPNKMPSISVKLFPYKIICTELLLTLFPKTFKSQPNLPFIFCSNLGWDLILGLLSKRDLAKGGLLHYLYGGPMGRET